MLSAFSLWCVLFCDLAAAHPPVNEPVVVVSGHRFRAGKPPSVRHTFDVTLHNPSGEPRWLILPMMFPYSGKKEPVPGGKAEKMVDHLLGAGVISLVICKSANFQAVKLPGHGGVTLRDLSIDSWFDGFPPSTELEVIVARGITVGGEALEKVVTVKSSDGASVTVPAEREWTAMGTMWQSPPNDPFPVVLDVESRAKLTVSLK
jgi:hypothetical protein